MPRSNDKSDTSFYNQQKLDRLKSLRENVNWEMEDERRELFRQIYPLVRDWHEQLPNLRDIFQAEEMDHLLWHSIDYKRNSWDNDPGELFVKLVARSGYRDEPGVDEAGKQSLNRTTPIHRVARGRPPYWCLRVADLFQIYQRFDANYSDESGFTHFHAACMSGCERSVEKFLELGRVDPNLVWRETGESPLHLALEYKRMEVFQSLMRYGADPTLANEDGSTPLHVMCKTKVDRTWVSMLLALSQEKGRPIRIDARDKSGNTPLHLALACCNNETVEWLMRRTDLNSANAEGSTPLHLACQRRRLGLAGLIFEISDEKRQAVRLDARDNLGRTPLQWAVANLEPDAIDVLLNRGADLSNLVFPTESYFGKSSELQCRYRISLDFKVALAADALAVVERLEKRGYELDRGDALTIMRFFAENRMFQKSAGLERLWCDGKKFAGRAKKIAIRPSLTLYELIRLRPEEAAKLLTYSDYYQLWKHHRLLLGRHEAALVVHLCEKMSRGFFRSWALDSFAELTRQKLPIELCQIIFGKQLMNKDFRNICLAASGRDA